MNHDDLLHNRAHGYLKMITYNDNKIIKKKLYSSLFKHIH